MPKGFGSQPSVLAVGQRYHPEKNSWPEAGEYNFRGGQHELVIGFGNLTQEEINDVRRAECQFALFREGYLIFFLYRFGNSIPWSDAPYAWHLVPKEQRDLPINVLELTGDSRAVLQVVLIESTTGIVKALRQVSLSHEFTKVLHSSIRDQAMSDGLPADYDVLIGDIYRRYPDSDLIVEAPGVISCKGGE